VSISLWSRHLPHCPTTGLLSPLWFIGLLSFVGNNAIAPGGRRTVASAVSPKWAALRRNLLGPNIHVLVFRGHPSLSSPYPRPGGQQMMVMSIGYPSSMQGGGSSSSSKFCLRKLLLDDDIVSNTHVSQNCCSGVLDIPVPPEIIARPLHKDNNDNNNE
jgi:hypothetical protein